MTTTISSGSSSGVNPILPLADERDKVKKLLKMDMPAGGAPRTHTKEYWEVVHCTVCTTDFYKGELPPPTGSGPQSCPPVQGAHLETGQAFQIAHEDSRIFCDAS